MGKNHCKGRNTHKHRNQNKKHIRDNQKGHKRSNGRRKPDRNEYVQKLNLKEVQVGITEFVSTGSGFTGVVKSRYSDFQVNEIDLSGTVLKLDDLTIPQPIDDGFNTVELEKYKKELDHVISEEKLKEIEKLVCSNDPDSKAIEIDVTELDKETRTKIHKVMKTLYETKIVSSTVAVAEKKYIKLRKAKMEKENNNRTRWNFPGEYVHFIVYKENRDTGEVAATIANHLNLKPSQVNYSGTKDKRAKTTQKFCIKRRSPSQIVRSVKSLPLVHVGNFEFKNTVLKLGDLKGNRFRIALRNLNGDIDQIEISLKEIKEKGFINYFGLQRFGNCAAIPTYEVGIALLKCDYKLACELILKPRDNDINFMRSIREIWWKNRNSSEAAAMFQNDKFIEKKLLNGLAQYGESDYASALRKIPRNMLLLYPHAYQSLVFNRIASRRIREFGLKLIPGDLVYRNKDEQDFVEAVPLNDDEQMTIVGDNEDGQTEDLEQEIASNKAVNDDGQTENLEQEIASNKAVNDETTAGGNEGVKTEVLEQDTTSNKAVDDETTKELSIFKQKVKPLTEEDISSGNYTIFDIVLALPGYDITYPANEVGQWYEDILKENDLTSEKLKHNVKTYALAGAYRKLLIQPQNMTWEFKSYDSADTTLIASDWDQFQNINLPEASKEGQFKALLIDICLPSSVYATMFIRELLKTDTSAEIQAQIEKDEMLRHNKDMLIKDENTPCLSATDSTVAASSEKRKAVDVASDKSCDEKRTKLNENQ